MREPVSEILPAAGVSGSEDAVLVSEGDVFVREAVTLLCTEPNGERRALRDAMLEALSQGQIGETGVAQAESAAAAAYEEGRQKRYGGCFTQSCIEQLENGNILGSFDEYAERVGASITVKNVTVEAAQTAGRYRFEATLAVTVGGEETEATVSGSAQCLESDGGKVSHLRLRPDDFLREGMDAG